MGPYVSHRQSSPERNLSAALTTLLARLEVRVTRSTVEEAVRGHPDYPSLQAAAAVVRWWGLDADAFRVPLEMLGELPCPSIIHLEGEDERFAVLECVDERRVCYFDPAGGRVTERRSDFVRRWSGRVFVVEVASGAGEKDYARRARRQKARDVLRLLRLVAALAFGAVVVTLLAVRWRDAPARIAYLVLAGLGLGLTGPLVLHHLGRKEPWLVRKLCGTGPRVDCERVLKSAAATLPGGVPVADVGLVYFAGTLLTLVLAGLEGETAASLPLLKAVSFMALPYVAFALYYQAVVIGRWCALCLGVHAVLVAQAIVMAAVPFDGPRAFALSSVIRLAAGFGSAALAWSTLRPLVHRAAGREELEFQVLRLRRDPRLLAAATDETVRVASTVLPCDIVTGRANAPNRLTLVLHPECPFCGPAYRSAMTLLDRLGESLSVCVRFLCAGPGHRGWDISAYVVGLQLEGRADEALSFLDDWYGRGKNRSTWRSRRPLRSPADSLLGAEGSLRQTAAWAEVVGIPGTPTVLWNSRLLTSSLHIDDLAYLPQFQPGAGRDGPTAGAAGDLPLDSRRLDP